MSCLQACNLSTVEAEAGGLVKIQDRSALIGESQASLSYRARSCFKKSQNQEAQQRNTCGKKIEGTIEGRKRTCQRSGGNGDDRRAVYENEVYFHICIGFRKYNFT